MNVGTETVKGVTFLICMFYHNVEEMDGGIVLLNFDKMSVKTPFKFIFI